MAIKIDEMRKTLVITAGFKRKHLFLTAKNTHFFVRQKTKIRGLRLKSGKPKEKILQN